MNLDCPMRSAMASGSEIHSCFESECLPRLDSMLPFLCIFVHLVLSQPSQFPAHITNLVSWYSRTLLYSIDATEHIRHGVRATFMYSSVRTLRARPWSYFSFSFIWNLMQGFFFLLKRFDIFIEVSSSKHVSIYNTG